MKPVICNDIEEFLFKANQMALDGNFGFYLEFPVDTDSAKIQSRCLKQDIHFDYCGTDEVTNAKVFYSYWETPFEKDGRLTARFAEEHLEYVALTIMKRDCPFPVCETIGQQLFLLAMTHRR